MTIRSYTPPDYEQVAALYKQSELYGGQYDDNRDSEERLRKRINADADAIFIAEKDGKIVGTISLIEDGRVAWLFRYAVLDPAATKPLYEKAIETLKSRGHRQVLVYTPVGDAALESRYEQLGFNKGGDYTCYWKDI